LEGGAGDYDLSVFTNLEGPEVRNEVADYFLEAGRISAGEFFGIKHRDDVKISGVETPGIYLENLKVYKDSLEYMGRVTGYIEGIEKILNALKPEIYSKDLIDYDRNYTAYKKGDLEFKDYILYLAGALGGAPDAGLKEYPNIRRLLETLEKEKLIDFKKANTERDALVKVLEGKISKVRLSGLIEKTLEFKVKRINSLKYYTFITALAEEIGLDVSKYPNFSLYRDYLSIYEKVDKAGVNIEMRGLEKKCQESFFENKGQRELALRVSHASMLKDIFNIDMIPEDYRYAKSHMKEFTAEWFVSFIRSQAGKVSVPFDLPEGIESLDGFTGQMLRFFELGYKRDLAFIENMKKTKDMNGTDWDYAVLITGGFHTENLCELLKKENISYASITPAFVNPKGYEAPYKKLLAGGDSPMEDLVAKSVKVFGIQVASMLNQLGILAEGKEFKNRFDLAVEARAALANFGRFSLQMALSGRKIVITRDRESLEEGALKAALIGGKITEISEGDESFYVGLYPAGTEIALENEEKMPEVIIDMENMSYKAHEAYVDSEIAEAFKTGKVKETGIDDFLGVLEKNNVLSAGEAAALRSAWRNFTETHPEVRIYEIADSDGKLLFDGHASRNGIYVVNKGGLSAEKKAEIFMHELGAYVKLAHSDNRFLSDYIGFQTARASGAEITPEIAEAMTPAAQADARKYIGETIPVLLMSGNVVSAEGAFAGRDYTFLNLFNEDGRNKNTIRNIMVSLNETEAFKGIFTEEDMNEEALGTLLGEMKKEAAGKRVELRDILRGMSARLYEKARAKEAPEMKVGEVFVGELGTVDKMSGVQADMIAEYVEGRAKNNAGRIATEMALQVRNVLDSKEKAEERINSVREDLIAGRTEEELKSIGIRPEDTIREWKNWNDIPAAVWEIMDDRAVRAAMFLGLGLNEASPDLRARGDSLDTDNVIFHLTEFYPDFVRYFNVQMKQEQLLFLQSLIAYAIIERVKLEKGYHDPVVALTDPSRNAEFQQALRDKFNAVMDGYLGQEKLNRREAWDNIRSRLNLNADPLPVNRTFSDEERERVMYNIYSGIAPGERLINALDAKYTGYDFKSDWEEFIKDNPDKNNIINILAFCALCEKKKTIIDVKKQIELKRRLSGFLKSNDLRTPEGLQNWPKMFGNKYLDMLTSEKIIIAKAPWFWTGDEGNLSLPMVPKNLYGILGSAAMILYETGVRLEYAANHPEAEIADPFLIDTSVDVPAFIEGQKEVAMGGDNGIFEGGADIPGAERALADILRAEGVMRKAQGDNTMLKDSEIVDMISVWSSLFLSAVAAEENKGTEVSPDLERNRNILLEIAAYIDYARGKSIAKIAGELKRTAGIDLNTLYADNAINDEIKRVTGIDNTASGEKTARDISRNERERVIDTLQILDKIQDADGQKDIVKEIKRISRTGADREVKVEKKSPAASIRIEGLEKTGEIAMPALEGPKTENITLSADEMGGADKAENIPVSLLRPQDIGEGQRLVITAEDAREFPALAKSTAAKRSEDDIMREKFKDENENAVKLLFGNAETDKKHLDRAEAIIFKEGNPVWMDMVLSAIEVNGGIQVIDDKDKKETTKSVSAILAEMEDDITKNMINISPEMQKVINKYETRDRIREVVKNSAKLDQYSGLLNLYDKDKAEGTQKYSSPEMLEFTINTIFNEQAIGNDQRQGIINFVYDRCVETKGDLEGLIKKAIDLYMRDVKDSMELTLSGDMEKKDFLTRRVSLYANLEYAANNKNLGPETALLMKDELFGKLAELSIEKEEYVEMVNTLKNGVETLFDYLEVDDRKVTEYKNWPVISKSSGTDSFIKYAIDKKIDAGSFSAMSLEKGNIRVPGFLLIDPLSGKAAAEFNRFLRIRGAGKTDYITVRAEKSADSDKTEIVLSITEYGKPGEINIHVARKETGMGYSRVVIGDNGEGFTGDVTDIAGEEGVVPYLEVLAGDKGVVLIRALEDGRVEAVNGLDAYIKAMAEKMAQTASGKKAIGGAASDLTLNELKEIFVNPDSESASSEKNSAMTRELNAAFTKVNARGELNGLIRELSAVNRNDKIFSDITRSDPGFAAVYTALREALKSAGEIKSVEIRASDRLDADGLTNAAQAFIDTETGTLNVIVNSRNEKFVKALVSEPQGFLEMSRHEFLESSLYADNKLPAEDKKAAHRYISALEARENNAKGAATELNLLMMKSFMDNTALLTDIRGAVHANDPDGRLFMARCAELADRGIKLPGINVGTLKTLDDFINYEGINAAGGRLVLKGADRLNDFTLLGIAVNFQLQNEASKAEKAIKATLKDRYAGDIRESLDIKEYDPEDPESLKNLKDAIANDPRMRDEKARAVIFSTESFDTSSLTKLLGEKFMDIKTNASGETYMSPVGFVAFGIGLASYSKMREGEYKDAYRALLINMANSLKTTDSPEVTQENFDQLIKEKKFIMILPKLEEIDFEQMSNCFKAIRAAARSL
ncbi:MAG: hypothetical protein ABH883_06930, partial [Candidatus Omnitrophota bacterium]